MISPNYILIPNDNVHRTTWADVIAADHTRQSLTVTTTIVEYLKNNADETFRSVEQRLRKERRFTHLVARERNPEVPEDVIFMNVKGQICHYYVWITTLNRDKARIQKLERVTNFQLNLERLEHAGVMQTIDPLASFSQVGGNLILTRETVEELGARYEKFAPEN